MLLTANSITDISDELFGFFRDPGILIGIPIALLGAIFMSLGAQYQHRGVGKISASNSDTPGFGIKKILQLLKRPSWVIGTSMLVLAIVCQLTALTMAPLIIVQPVGAVSLVITTLLNARVSGIRPTGASIMAIASCVLGIFAFVTIAAFVATESIVDSTQIYTILILMAVIAVLLVGGWLLKRKNVGPLFYVIATGTIYGFVATLAKVVIVQIQQSNFTWLTVLCIVALGGGTLLGMYFVQRAYASGPPDLVIAGLTVIDPIIAVGIGIVVLHEAAGAGLSVVIGFLLAGALAIYGVFSLARNHPQMKAK